MRFAKEAWPFVAPFLAAATVLFAFRRPAWGVAALAAGLLVLLFFRDPKRRFEGAPGIVIAPADGRVTGISLVEDPEIGPGRHRRIVTFLSVFDVHVQRCPVDGEVVHSELRRGLKLAAFRPDVGEKNEGHTQVFLTAAGARIGVRQLAGLIARRVVSYLRAGESRRRGDPLGVIKFGSRVDLFVPESYRVLVEVGARVRNGETPMAEPGGAP
ncbi:MAG: phosphatidylserine decarboxylase family protein [Thermoanaerobaculia bacterium]|nr:MAG: phosphatidylserine decarboxylase family protein [Thermoanaerobaculia bacterium]